MGDGRQVKCGGQATAGYATHTSTIHCQTVNDDYTSLMEPPARQDHQENFSFDEFVSFLFEPDMRPASEGEDLWFWNVESEIVARQICAYYVRLFREPTFLLDQFTKTQLKEGFWKIASHQDCCMSQVIGDSNLPFVLREEIIRSMADLFRLFFVTEPLDTSVFMWWDALCYDWHCGNRSRELGGEDEKIAGCIF